MIKLELNGTAEANFTKMMERMGTSDPAVVARRAFALLDLAFEIETAGHRLAVLTEDGTTEPLLNATEPP